MRRAGGTEDITPMDVLYDDGAGDNFSQYQDNDYDEDEDREIDENEEDDSNKQQRLMRACDNCRRKKVKCNGTKPMCSHCMRMKLACNYSPLVRKKRTRRSVIDKLQDRLASMEQMLQPLVERLQPNDPVVSAGIGGFGLGFGFAPPPPPTLAHPLGLPAPAQSMYIPQPGAQSVPRNIMYLTASAQSELPLPPPHIIEELMEIAITRMTPAAPPVSWTRLLRRLHSGQLPEYIICATISLAARFSNRPEFNCTPRYNAGREYAKRAAELIAGLVDKPDPDVVFCLVMLSLFEWGCGRGESAWTYTGMATRLAQRCRLHLVDEEDFNENVDEQSYMWANAEWRRRLWWHVYCGDRTSVIVASRPATVHDDDCVVNLPSHDHEWAVGTVPDEHAAPADPVSPTEAGTGGSDPSQTSQSLFSSRLPDSWWLVVELYRMCSRISEFANRRRRPVRASDIPRRQMFDILDRELEDLRSRFIPGMEFPPRTEWLLSGYANLGDGANGMSNICAIYFNIHLMYQASKIILYRSELPEYQHESISPELIERAKSVCIDAAHKQAEVIRWALDTVPVEEWDPRAGVWSLQGASVHVNAALVADNAIAEQSRRDLEVHLKLHVASDQYYHFNMAMVTMLHHVFNLRKKQRLAANAGGAAQTTELAPNETRIVIQHSNDTDPWIVPRCSSFLGFTYNYSQLRGILNNAIKQTTYSPPDAITEGGDNGQPEQQQHMAGYSQVLLNSPLAPVPFSAGLSNSNTPMMPVKSQPVVTNLPAASRSFSVDLSGGLWSPSANQAEGTAFAHALAAHPDAARLAALHLDTACESSTGLHTVSTSTELPTETAQQTMKRSFSGAVGPGNRKNAAGKAAAAKGTSGSDAQQFEQLQRLEDLRARVVLLQQLSGKQGGAANTLGMAGGNPAVITPQTGNMDPSSVPKDVNGFLSNFAESIGSVASQLGSGATAWTPKPETPGLGSNIGSHGPTATVDPVQTSFAQQGLINEAWLGGYSLPASAADHGLSAMTHVGPIGSISSVELQNIAAHAALVGQSAVSPAQLGFVPSNGGQQAPSYTPENIQGLMQRISSFNSQQGAGPQ
ncbi:hypothetical protein IW141_001346 [Coemansia sp. RSA 355]|nr:hypothetical protein IW141_001346 [Coemansia sp. RSA 355]